MLQGNLKLFQHFGRVGAVDFHPTEPRHRMAVFRVHEDVANRPIAAMAPALMDASPSQSLASVP